MKNTGITRSMRFPALSSAFGVALGQAAIAGFFYWFQVEKLREERAQRELELEHELAPLQMKFGASKQLLEAHVRELEGRKEMFLALMASVQMAPDQESRLEALGLARELIGQASSIHVVRQASRGRP